MSLTVAVIGAGKMGSIIGKQFPPLFNKIVVDRNEKKAKLLADEIDSIFSKDLGSFTFSALPGDLLGMVAGVVWAVTTLYIKKFLAHRTVPLQTLFYQVFFSAPPLFLMSFLLEDPTLSKLSWFGGASLFFQCIIIVFLSYLVWFELIHRHPVSLLHAFSFFTPVFGVLISGALLLRETIGANLIFALTLISVGMVLVNHQPEDKAVLEAS